MFSLRDERKHYEERPSMIPTIRNDNPSFIQARPGLSDDRLRSLTPSVFAGSPLPGVSERYAFVPTAQIVLRLRESGWIPVTLGTRSTSRVWRDADLGRLTIPGALACGGSAHFPFHDYELNAD